MSQKRVSTLVPANSLFISSAVRYWADAGATNGTHSKTVPKKEKIFAENLLMPVPADPAMAGWVDQPRQY